jgi:hypothetical protein
MQDDAIFDHIRAANRPEGETRRLITDILSTCWPGGLDDTTEPIARGWLRMWGPIKQIVEIPTCTCHEGRCSVCN